MAKTLQQKYGPHPYLVNVGMDTADLLLEITRATDILKLRGVITNSEFYNITAAIVTATDRNYPKEKQS
jgi:hypothetical protein